MIVNAWRKDDSPSTEEFAPPPDHIGLELFSLTGFNKYTMKSMMNIRREPAGWVARLVRDGQEHSRYFRFSNGGVRKSRAAAIKWRDKILRDLGERRWRQGPNRSLATNNTSGTIGVSKNAYGRWLATWCEDGKQKFKTFRTKREAVAHRKEQEKRLSG